MLQHKQAQIAYHPPITLSLFLHVTVVNEKFFTYLVYYFQLVKGVYIKMSN